MLIQVVLACNNKCIIKASEFTIYRKSIGLINGNNDITPKFMLSSANLLSFSLSSPCSPSAPPLPPTSIFLPSALPSCSLVSCAESAPHSHHQPKKLFQLHLSSLVQLFVQLAIPHVYSIAILFFLEDRNNPLFFILTKNKKLLLLSAERQVEILLYLLFLFAFVCE